MDYRKLGRTDLLCSVIGLGTARLTSYSSNISRHDAIRLVHAAADHGINVVDTADIYGQGDSEIVLGQSMRGRRDRFYVASKVGYRFARLGRLAVITKPILKPLVQRLGKDLAAALRQNVATLYDIDQNFSPEYIGIALDASLGRLKTDYLDMLFLHDPPQSVLQSGDAIAALARAKSAGKIRYFGISTSDPEVGEWVAASVGEISIVQSPANLESHSSLWPILQRCSAAGVGILANQTFGSADLRSNPQLAEFCRRNNLSYHQAIIGFAIHQFPITTALVGTTSFAHLLQNIEALTVVRHISFGELVSGGPPIAVERQAPSFSRIPQLIGEHG